ncbi:type II secretion system F family protein [Microbacterium sp. NPDC096154]|uniref:type II secretion system F family protein n=1 Tax=Microbacterium sp. NPDC096154 TaxID=3155549 RepID=UPI00331D99E1
MIALALALAACAAVVIGVGALRLLTTTGLEDIEAQYRTEVAAGRSKGFLALLDAAGNLALGTAVRAYGAERLRRLDARIRRAGRPDGVTVTVYVRRQAGFVVIGGVVMIVCAMVGMPLPGLVLAAILCGWMPFWLWSEGNRRQAQIDRELPDFLDVLGVTVTAGLGFRQAIERVCEFHDGALAQEMRRALQEMAVGVSRREAFVGLRERTRSEAVGTFVTAMLQAEELGVPLAEALASIAADVRREHAARVRQQAAKAGPKVSLAMTVTVLPAALLLIVASMLIANAEAFGGLF